MFLGYQKGPLANHMPCTKYTERTPKALADLSPQACATMHGPTFIGDGKKAILEWQTL